MSAIDPRPVPSLRERLIQNSQDRVLDEEPAPIRRAEPPRPVHVPPISTALDSDDEGFAELGPIKGGAVLTHKIRIARNGSSALSRLSVAFLGGAPSPVQVSLAPDGRFRIRPHPHPDKTTARVGINGSLPRLGPYCKAFGFRTGHYALEARDGALYGQLEKDETHG